MKEKDTRFGKRFGGNTRRMFFPSSPLEVLALEERFQQMSVEGYLVTGAFGAFYTFQKVAPKKRKFYVDYFYKASELDTNPAPSTKDYLGYVENTSWTHAFSKGKMQCFYTEDLEAPSIETEEVFRFQSLRKAALFQEVPMLLLGVLYALLWGQQLRTVMSSARLFARFMSSWLFLGFFFVALLFLLEGALGIYRILGFHIKNKRSFKTGEGMILCSPEEGKRFIRLRQYGKGFLGVPILWMFLSSMTNVVHVGYSVGMLLSLVILYVVFSKSSYATRKRNLFLLVMMSYLALLFSTNFMTSHQGVEVLPEGGKPLSLTEMGYPLEEGMDEFMALEKQKGFLASLDYYYHAFVFSEWPLDAALDDRLPFYEIGSFKPRMSFVGEQYVAMVLSEAQEVEPLHRRYPGLKELGYDGFVLQGGFMEIHGVLMEKGGSILLIRSHELFPEDQLLTLLMQESLD